MAGLSGIYVAKTGDTVKESLFKTYRSKELKNYNEITDYLAQKRGISVSEIPEKLMKLFDNALERERNGTGEGNKHPQLFNDETRRLLRFFRWVVNPDGSKTFYLKLFEDSEVYTRAENLIGSSQKIHPEQDEPLFDLLEHEYLVLVKRDLLTFGGEKIVPFYEWFANKGGSGPLGRWENDTSFQLHDHPQPISTDKKTPCHFYFDKSILKSAGETPTWDTWELKIPTCLKDIFRAFIASVFDPENRGRQCLWLTDNGASGKSTIQKAIKGFMNGVGVGAISQHTLSSNFGYSSLFGFRLLFYGDCKNTKLLHYEKIHNLLGGDVVLVEYKNKNPFPSEVYAKVLVNSNVPPEIDVSKTSETSRLLFIPLEHDSEEVMKAYCMTDKEGNIKYLKNNRPIVVGNNEFLPNLIKEMPRYLYKCMEAYKELCPTRCDIEINDEAWDLMVMHCCSNEYKFFSQFVVEELKFDKKSNIAEALLTKEYTFYLQEAKRGTKYVTFMDFKKFLGSEYKIEPSFDKDRQVIYKGIGLVND